MERGLHLTHLNFHQYAADFKMQYTTSFPLIKSGNFLVSFFVYFLHTFLKKNCQAEKQPATRMQLHSKHTSLPPFSLTKPLHKVPRLHVYTNPSPFSSLSDWSDAHKSTLIIRSRIEWFWFTNYFENWILLHQTVDPKTRKSVIQKQV